MPKDFLKKYNNQKVGDVLREESGADSVIKSYHQAGKGGQGFDSDRDRANKVKVPKPKEDEER